MGKIKNWSLDHREKTYTEWSHDKADVKVIVRKDAPKMSWGVTHVAYPYGAGLMWRVFWVVPKEVNSVVRRIETLIDMDQVRSKAERRAVSWMRSHRFKGVS